MKITKIQTNDQWAVDLIKRERLTAKTRLMETKDSEEYKKIIQEVETMDYADGDYD